MRILARCSRDKTEKEEEEETDQRKGRLWIQWGGLESRTKTRPKMKDFNCMGRHYDMTTTSTMMKNDHLNLKQNGKFALVPMACIHKCIAFCSTSAARHNANRMTPKTSGV